MSDTENTTTEQQEPLGEAGKKALQAERDARTQADKRVKELEQQLASVQSAFESEKQTLQASIDDLTGRVSEASTEATTAQSQALKLRVALRKGLSEKFADRLQGDDEAALEADADEFAQLTVGQGKTTPKPDLSQGAKGSGGGATSTAQQFADAIPNF